MNLKLVRSVFMSFVLAWGVFTFTGMSCRNQTPRTVVYNTIFSLQKSTLAAYDNYLDGVISGTIPTNGLPKVSAEFNKFQMASMVAINLNQAGTNTLASSNLVSMANSVLNLIVTFSK